MFDSPALRRSCLALAIATATTASGAHAAQNADELRAKVSAAAGAGAASLALDLAQSQPEAFDPVELASLRHAAIAQRIRWARAEMRESAAPRRNVAMDSAIADAVALRASLPAIPAYDAVRLRLTHDLIYALAQRGRTDEAIALFEGLRQPLEKTPAYVLVAAGQAYELAERRDEAIRCFEAALASATPGDIDRVAVREQLIYTYLDRGRAEEAAAQLALAEKESPPYVALAPLPETPNPDYERANRLRAQYLVYTGNLNAGQRVLDALQHDAPFSSSLRAAATDARMGDGHPEEARNAFRADLNERPDDIEALVGLARSSLTLRDYKTAREVIGSLSEALPEQGAVRALQRDLQVHDSPLLTVDAGGGRTGDDRPFAARNEWSIDTHLYSAPIAENYRLLVHQFVGRADLDPERKTRVRNGVGVDYRKDRVEAQAELHRSNGDNGRTGASGMVHYYPSDGWRLTAQVDSDLNDIPWRAYADGTHAWGMQLGVRWQPSSRTYVDATYRRDDYSDGNLRQSGAVSVSRTLYDAPRHGVTGWVSVEHSDNRRSDVSYFSPPSDNSGQATVMYEWRPWRDGRRAFRQRVYGTAGLYHQQGVGTDPIWEVRLEQVWDLQRDTRIVYGVGYGKRPYDGEPEKRLSAYFSLNIPF
ncbi:poly-beta-1,6 N-acetyl-D-glucosamine export porin PgaA [Verticiella sediminum]|uniref:Poly-beta-1,6 N-acetyl-D-glucosamine export porin PgaA n=1 Tax=Verticiella sediminum TaxID=1247510 RepID=A0A556AYA2_9BURK|nr:poly-beta-1,6 N-acetyl-D-glucosamine export porin PgaA [Verticiella sediminum]TSH97907.1 poly-beta-1,6 N-acetyl-D-glucosamine export porin PgaA [Verticiella sediminum]